MREILFRGKAKAIAGCPYNNGKSDGEWVFGYIFPDLGAMKIRQFEPDRPECNDYEVDPETVGQYTGTKTYSKYDDELHKIFEDDLCHVTEFDCEENDENHLCQVMFDSGTFYFKDVNSDWCRAFYEVGDIESDVELIGNIHDNPEILKGGGNDG